MKSFKIIRGSIIKTEGGNLFKLLKKNHLKKNWKFGELYFSEVYQNKIKGWHWHKFQTSTLFAIEGQLKVVLFDEKKFTDFILSKELVNTLVIEPGTWYAFKGLKKKK